MQLLALLIGGVGKGAVNIGQHDRALRLGLLILVTPWGGGGKEESTTQRACGGHSVSHGCVWLFSLSLKCDCAGSAAKPRLTGLFCFLVAGADSGAPRPSRFWLGSLLSAGRLQPNVSGVLPTALYVRKARVEVSCQEEPAYEEGWQGEPSWI